MKRLLYGLLILLLLAVAACSGGSDEPTVRGVLDEQRIATETVVEVAAIAESTELENSRGFSQPLYVLMDDALHLFRADGTAQTVIEGVLDAWHSGDRLFYHDASGIWMTTMEGNANRIADLPPDANILTRSVSPNGERLLLGYRLSPAENYLLFEEPTPDYSSLQSYLLVDTVSGQNTDDLVMNEDDLGVVDDALAGYVMLQTAPFWTTDNNLLVFLRLVPTTAFDLEPTAFSFRSVRHEAFLLDGATGTDERLEDSGLSFNNFDFFTNELGVDDFWWPNAFDGLEMAPLQPTLDYGRTVVQFADDTYVSGISVVREQDDNDVCSTLVVSRDPIEGVFLPTVLHQGDSANISNLILIGETVWFLRAVARDCDPTQIDLTVIAANFDETETVVFSTADTGLDATRLIFEPSADRRVILWGGGDAQNVNLMATYPDSELTEVIFHKPRTDDTRGIIAAGWLAVEDTLATNEASATDTPAAE